VNVRRSEVIARFEREKKIRDNLRKNGEAEDVKRAEYHILRTLEEPEGDEKGGKGRRGKEKGGEGKGVERGKGKVGNKGMGRGSAPTAGG